MKLRDSEYIPSHLISRIGNTALLYLIAFISPIIGLIESIIQFRKPYAKNLFWIFCIFYGMVHIYMPEFGFGYEGGADSVRYAENLKVMHESGISWEGLTYSFYNSEGGNTDIYMPIVTFIVSIFTGNAHVLFMIYALVFGYFYSRNIWYVIENTNVRFNYGIIIFVVSFALITPIWQINGVRMWTALQVFIYGLLPYIINKDKKYLIWCFASIFFHFSFISIAAILAAYLVLPSNLRKPSFFFILFILSTTIKELDISLVREKLLSLGLSSFEDRIMIYTSDTAVEKVNEAKDNWAGHVILAQNMRHYIYIILLAFSFIILKYKSRTDIKNIFCLTSLLYSFANIASLVPSGGRFMYIAQMMVLVLTLRFYIIPINIRMRSLLNILSLALIFPAIFSFRVGMDFWGISLLVTNPLTCWFITDNTPIISFIKR